MDALQTHLTGLPSLVMSLVVGFSLGGVLGAILSRLISWPALLAAAAFTWYVHEHISKTAWLVDFDYNGATQGFLSYFTLLPLGLGAMVATAAYLMSPSRLSSIAAR